MTTDLTVSEVGWKQIEKAPDSDEVLELSHTSIKKRLPEDRAAIADCLKPYFDVIDEFAVHDNFSSSSASF